MASNREKGKGVVGPSKKIDADSVCVLIDDASQFALAERGLWHWTNVGSAIPKRVLWQRRDGISILSSASNMSTPPEDGMASQMIMGASTATRFIYAAYRLVFAVDISPSLFALDSHSGSIPFDDAIASLVSVAHGLVQPMECAPTQSELHLFHTLSDNQLRTSGSGGAGAPVSVTFSPQLHVSVVAQAASTSDKVLPLPHVLLHGFALTSESVGELIGRATSALRRLEGTVAAEARAAGASGSREGSRPVPSISPLLESAAGVLKLLPASACGSIVLVTDCATSLPPCAAYGSVVMQLLRHDVAVHAVQLGTCSGVHSGLGGVPDTESMQFLTTATGGFRARSRDLVDFARPLPRPGPPPEESDDAASGSAAPAFTTAYWSRLQQQVFVRTSVLNVPPQASPPPPAAPAADVHADGGIAPSDVQFVKALQPHTARPRIESSYLSNAGASPMATPRRSGESPAAPSPRIGTLSGPAPSPRGTAAVFTHRADITTLATTAARLSGSQSFGNLLARSASARWSLADSAGGAPDRSPSPPAGELTRDELEFSTSLQIRAPEADGLLAAQKRAAGFMHVPTPLMLAAADGSTVHPTAGNVAASTSVARLLQSGANAVDEWLAPPSWIDDDGHDGKSAHTASTLAATSISGHPSSEMRALPSASLAFPWSGPPPPVFMMRHRVRGYRLRVEPRLLLDARLKEGFRVVAEGGAATGRSAQKLQLLLVWQPQVMVIYTCSTAQRAGAAASGEPASDGSKSGTPSYMKVSVDIVGRQDFVRLLEATAQQQRQGTGTSVPAAGQTSAQISRLSATAVEPQRVRALRHFLSVVEQVDRALVHACAIPAILRQHPDSVPRGSLPPKLRMLLTPLASLSVPVWHRFFDVERLEVWCAPILSGVGPAYHGGPTEIASDSGDCDLLACVSRALASWATSPLPEAGRVFGTSSDPATTGPFPSPVSKPTPAAQFVKLLLGPSVAALPAASRPPSTEGTHRSAARPPPDAGLPLKPTSAGQSTRGSVTADPPKPAPAKPRTSAPGSPPVIPRIAPFALARASRFAPAGWPASTQSSLVVVHIAFFGCLPPARAVQMALLRVSIEASPSMALTPSSASREGDALRLARVAPRVTGCPLMRVMPVSDTTDAAVDTHPAIDEGPALFSEADQSGALERGRALEFEASVCCGGAALPQQLLFASLWSRCWRWTIQCSGAYGARSLASTAMSALIAARMGGSGAASAPCITPGQPWSILLWGRGTPDGPVSMRVHLARIVDTNLPQPSARAVVQAGSHVPADSGNKRRFVCPRGDSDVQPCVLQVALVVSAPADSGLVTCEVRLWMEPREGSVILTAAGSAPTDNARSGPLAAVASARGFWAALSAATRAVDASVLLRVAQEAGLQPEALQAASAPLGSGATGLATAAQRLSGDLTAAAGAFEPTGWVDQLEPAGFAAQTPSAGVSFKSPLEASAAAASPAPVPAGTSAAAPAAAQRKPSPVALPSVPDICRSLPGHLRTG